MRAYERLLKYVSIYTTSDPDSATVPSSMRQYDLARILVDELNALGLENVHVDENGIVYGWLSATPGCEARPALGFIAHMDTAPDCSGENVKPQIIERYDGGDVVLPGSGETLSPAAFPGLQKLAGMTLITTDGTTLLGADDKAGVAEIMTMAEQLMSHPEIEHGTIKIGFTPDEEIGRGANYFDVEGFGANFAYTVDGGELGELEYENFNAGAAKVVIHGLSIHTGSAKDAMVNASLLAMEFHQMLPVEQNPRYTTGYEGFFHLGHIEGEVELAEMDYIIRDHDAEKYAQKEQVMRDIAAYMNHKYGEGTVELTITESYRNMKEKIEPHMHLIENAKKAFRACGVEPKIVAVRGGTDGARLSYMGLPCPNLSTGGHNFHGRFEYIPVESMDKMVETIINIAKIYAD